MVRSEGDMSLKNPVTPTGIDSVTVRLVAQLLNHYAAPGPNFRMRKLGPGFFSDISPSDRTMALGSTQPLVKMSTRNIPVGKGGRCVKLKTSPPSRAECHEIWDPKPPGTLWATPGLLRDCITFTFTHTENLRTIKQAPKIQIFLLHR
jgi:hypothetical protein